MKKHYPDLKMQLKAEHLAVRLGTGSSNSHVEPYDTMDTQMVTHPSTNMAQCYLTSVI